MMSRMATVCCVALLGSALGAMAADWDKIEKRLLEIWDTALTAELTVTEHRPAPAAVTPTQSATILPFRPRPAAVTCDE